MDAVTGILLLVGVYFGSIYGGSIAAILLNTPGTPASAATSMDGYQMTVQGKAGKALAIAAVGSGIGGLFSVIVLILIAPALSKIALGFSSPEMFGLAIFGLSIISSISGKSEVKGLISGFVGILICTIGLDPMTSYLRLLLASSDLVETVSLDLYVIS